MEYGFFETGLPRTKRCGKGGEVGAGCGVHLCPKSDEEGVTDFRCLEFGGECMEALVHGDRVTCCVGHCLGQLGDEKKML